MPQKISNRTLRLMTSPENVTFQQKEIDGHHLSFLKFMYEKQIFLRDPMCRPKTYIEEWWIIELNIPLSKISTTRTSRWDSKMRLSQPSQWTIRIYFVSACIIVYASSALLLFVFFDPWLSFLNHLINLLWLRSLNFECANLSRNTVVKLTMDCFQVILLFQWWL